MKVIIVFSVALFAFHISIAQLQFQVSTDKTIYNHGDTVLIEVSAQNLSSDTIQLVFSTTCQIRYYIDDIAFSPDNICFTVFTYVKIPPFQIHSWQVEHPNNVNIEPITSGTHTIVGEVIGYGKSDTLDIQVDSTTMVVTTGEFTLPSYRLEQNYPNPFNAETIIKFSVSRSSHIRIDVFNNLGKIIRIITNGKFAPGHYSIRFAPHDLSTGVYFYRMIVGEYVDTKKLVVVR